MQYVTAYAGGALFRLVLAAVLAAAVVGCTQTDSSLGVGSQAASLNDPDAARFPDLKEPPSGPDWPQMPPDGVAAIGRVYFAPVVGAPADKVGALARQLRPAGSARGVALVDSADQSQTHQIKGYFSAFSENGSTTIVHVWDVILPDGQRVHRIQGQESVPEAGRDPWASVPDATMAAIADKVMAEFAAWRAGGA